MLTHRRTARLVRLTLVLLLVCGLAGLLALARPAGASAASGHLDWWYTEDSPTHALDAITAAAAGPGGSLYAAANLGDDWGDGADLGTYRFRPTFGKLGSVIWEKLYAGPSHQADFPIALAVDQTGSVVTAGQTHTATGGMDWLLIKRSPSGARRWVTTYDGSLHGYDYLDDAACDQAGNVYACGMSSNSPTSADWVVAKFRASDGKRLWRHLYSGPGASAMDDWAHALAVDAAGDSYVAGQSNDSTGLPDILVMKLSPGGRQTWVRRVDGAAHLDDYANGIALRGGIVYVAAKSSPTADETQVMLLRYDTRGHRAWQRTWQAAPGTISDVSGLAVDGAGNAVVSGSSLKGTPFSKAFLVSWSPSGHQRWGTTFWKTTTGESAGFFDVAADGSGRIWAVGNIGTSGSTEDALLVRYRPSGSVAWAQVFDGDDHLDDWFNVVTLWGKNSLFAGGVTGTTAGYDDVLAAKYTR